MEQIKPVHPGEILKEFLPKDITVSKAARCLGITRQRLSKVLKGEASITPELAMRIGLATNTSPESWHYAQNKLNLWNETQRFVKESIFVRSIL